MDELFGAPMSTITATLAVLFLITVIFLLNIGIRNTVLFKMALRNVRRRKAQTGLIIVGMMLATAIISSAFTIGDSMSHSIEADATDDLRYLDQLVRINDESEVWQNETLPDSFPETLFQQIAPAFEADPDVDGILPAYVERVAVANLDERQFEVRAILTGVDPEFTGGFGVLRDAFGNPMHLQSLGPREVYIDTEGAKKINASAGDTLGIVLGPKGIQQFTVRGIADGWYMRLGDTKVVITVPLKTAQELLGRKGELNRILVSNRGGFEDAESLTPAIQQRLAALPVIVNNGLELFPVKTEIIDLANQIASLFVSIFTTFGLFSIGVGVLLIFLIFTMLAAERKSEMGTSRALGMQRGQLIQMFIAEGSIYSIGSATIGAFVGIGVGALLVLGVAEAFAEGTNGARVESFNLRPAVTARSVLVAFFIGSIVTFVTVTFASWRTSRINIVRAIRDTPEPQLQRAGRATLVWGVSITAVGIITIALGVQTYQQTPFGLGVSLIPIGVAMILRWRGLAQRWTLTAVGSILVTFWLLPDSAFHWITTEWESDFSIFFLSGSMVVTGSVLVVMNNSQIILGLAMRLLVGFHQLAPVLKSAVSYPLRSRFRTGLSVAMFAVIIFSIVVMSTLTTGFQKLFDNQDRLAGGYDVIAFARTELNPVQDLRAAVAANPDLNFVRRANAAPSVGTIRTIFDGSAKLGNHVTDVNGSTDHAFADATISGVDDDFVATNQYTISLATEEFVDDSDFGFNSTAIWKALRDDPGLAVVSALLLPTRNNFEFNVESDKFRMNVADLFMENHVMEPIPVIVRNKETGNEVTLQVIAVVDDFGFFLPQGLFTSSRVLSQGKLGQIPASSFFFHVEPGTHDPAGRIEAAFFNNAMDTIDIDETLTARQSASSAFNSLLVGFMALGLVVGIAALGVISARAVVERRHEIGVLRAIGFSRGMVQASFLLESTFIAALGIGLGIILGLAMSVNIVNSIRANEPNIELVIPWVQLLIIGLGAYLFSLLTTYLPSMQASQVKPADALRYE